MLGVFLFGPLLRSPGTVTFTDSRLPGLDSVLTFRAAALMAGRLDHRAAHHFKKWLATPLPGRVGSSLNRTRQPPAMRRAIRHFFGPFSVQIRPHACLHPFQIDP